MAEAIVHLALNKLAEAAVTETLRLYGAGGQLNSLQHELRWIQAFLKDAEAKTNNLDERAKTWVSEVREVAYRIEDVIDTFMADVDDHNNQQGVISVLKKILRFFNPNKLPIVLKLTNEMDAIQTRLREIKECTEKYCINRELKEDLSSSAMLQRRPIRGVMLPDEDDPDVVGLETDKENIVRLLLDLNTPRRRVVSIIGQGGLGKTTLAKRAYNSDKVKREFEIRVWLSISKQFELINVLSMTLEGIRPLDRNEKDLLKDPKSQPRAEQYFARQLNSLLKQKRYLIIMDDVWTPDLWDKVKDVLPDTKNGSRVLVTTRISEIATKADSTCDPYAMRYLSVEESQTLLLRNAFPFQDPEAYLDGLSDLPQKFARKCGNLPLALKIVGGRLSRELPTYNSWHKILQKLNWHDGDEQNCTNILATSYEDTPAYLKPCFMYFALYPEDYQIKIKPLIRLWVSEGFIPERNSRTMEETAEDYLEELVQRSMIQVVRRKFNGSIKYCRVHDLLRELAIQKAEENNFLQIISNQGDTWCGSSTTVRRAAVHSNCEDIMQYTGPNLRSLFYSVYNMRNIESFRSLKILCGIEYYVTPHSKILKKMTQLRYFGKFEFEYWKSDMKKARYHRISYWKSISHMKNLQTLHLTGFGIDWPQPDCIWDIKTLRHVIIKQADFLGPPPKSDLPNLQTLKRVKVRESWLVEGWPKMPNIRVLELILFPPGYKESFCNFLMEAPHLISLYVYFFGAPYERLDMRSFPSYNHMQSLYVGGKWNNFECIGGVNQYKTLDIHLFPIHLIKLCIDESDFQEDPMPIIEKLKNLRKLTLLNSQQCQKQLSCSAGGFPSLEYLKLYGLSLVEWKVEKGGMPLLKEIYIPYCPNLVAIPELQHMTSLKTFTLKDVHEDLYEKLTGEESYKLKHIPYIDW
ncbi:hypothetical protein LUZ61_014102 [Rhynchospora tenuis]|uniref:Uncharacterized protein n=1 Tax=Rhynchospora tenuis TaxID=198213 RepID=A0AAD5Z1E4_9POAL|nr:hypothetical protein LUZ61_014102 [Rhynchospora tenuis]